MEVCKTLPGSDFGSNQVITANSGFSRLCTNFVSLDLIGRPQNYSIWASGTAGVKTDLLEFSHFEIRFLKTSDLFLEKTGFWGEFLVGDDIPTKLPGPNLFKFLKLGEFLVFTSKGLVLTLAGDVFFALISIFESVSSLVPSLSSFFLPEGVLSCLGVLSFLVLVVVLAPLSTTVIMLIVLFDVLVSSCQVLLFARLINCLTLLPVEGTVALFLLTVGRVFVAILLLLAFLSLTRPTNCPTLLLIEGGGSCEAW